MASLSLPLPPSPTPLHKLPASAANAKTSVHLTKSHQFSNYSSYLHHISSLCKQGLIGNAFSILTHMELQAGFQAGADIYGELLQGCVYERAVFLGQQIHARLIKKGCFLEKNEYVETKLVIFYAKCGLSVAAGSLFTRLRKQNVFSWAAMIGLHCREGCNERALLGVCEMMEDGYLPDNFVVPNALKACSALMFVGFGRAVHGYVVKMGFGSCVFVSSSLVDMYGKCGVVSEALKVFDGMPERNAVAWNSMIVGCVHNRMNEEALELFLDMRVEGIQPTRVTVSSFLSASANLEAVDEGKQGHAIAVISNLELDNILGSSLINFYSKVGLMEDAESVFHRMVERDVVTWNLLISSYVQEGQVELAIDTCLRMRSEKMRFDSVTLSSILTASADSRDIELGREGHGYCIRNNLDSDLVVASSLINMYAKSERIDAARSIFDTASERDQVMWNSIIASYAQVGLSGEALTLFYQMQLHGVPPNVVSWNSVVLGFLRNGQFSEVENMLVQMDSSGVQPNLITWTTLISGFAQNGCLDKAIQIFQQMQGLGFRPNVVSIVGVLSACTNLASLSYGKAVHAYINRHAMDMSVSVVTSLIDMYAKCGDISLAEKIFEGFSRKEIALYNSMMSGYALHGHTKKVLTLFQQMQDGGLEPDDVTFTAILSACAHTGMVDEGLNVFNKMLTLYNLRPSIEHYGCVVRLLSGCGNLTDSLKFVSEMPIEPDAPILGTLLASCREQKEIEVGEVLFEKLSCLEPRNLGNYVTLSNTYAAAGKWENVKEVREKMSNKGRKTPGCCWIQVGNDVHSFVAGDKSHPQTDLIYDALRWLEMEMKLIGCSYICY